MGGRRPEVQRYILEENPKIQKFEKVQVARGQREASQQQRRIETDERANNRKEQRAKKNRETETVKRSRGHEEASSVRGGWGEHRRRGRGKEGKQGLEAGKEEWGGWGPGASEAQVK